MLFVLGFVLSVASCCTLYVLKNWTTNSMFTLLRVCVHTYMLVRQRACAHISPFSHAGSLLLYMRLHVYLSVSVLEYISPSLSFCVRLYFGLSLSLLAWLCVFICSPNIESQPCLLLYRYLCPQKIKSSCISLHLYLCPS